MNLDDLKTFRSSPEIFAEGRTLLIAELRHRLAACEWFTVGVMAPTAARAIRTLREFEQALEWTPLVVSGDPLPDGPVFLKGNQRTGTAVVRSESGLGVGILISGQAPSNPEAEDTWGPLPLDLFS